jgi:hypothetical protein
MKCRQSFVANSSSSSFIIGTKNFKKELKDVPVWANKLITRMIDGLLDSTPMTTKEDVDKHFVNQYGYRGCDTIEAILNDEHYLVDPYNEILDSIKNGYQVYDLDVEYHDETKIAFVESLPKEDDGCGIYLIRSNN